MHKIKISKRQRKRVNFAMLYSIRNGQKHEVGGTSYVGAVPQYAEVGNHIMGIPVQHVKVQKGIPFVRVSY